MKCLNLTDLQYDLPKNDFSHFIRVDHLFLASKVTTSEQISFLKSINISTAIDLKSPDETEFNDQLEFQKSGINYYHFPIKNIGELKLEQLQKFSELINSNDKILVYCMSGNRVGALLALNSCLVCGHPKKRALDFGEKVGMKNPQTKAIVSERLGEGRLK